MGWNRRRVLRGMLNGGVVCVGLPLLDCFLNGNGTALADGGPMPVRFGTWFWALGYSANVFTPKQTGPRYDLPEELASLKNIRDYINILTNFTAFRDDAQNFCHYTGWVISRTGTAPQTRVDVPGETLDVTIANAIGRATRFKILTATATGDASVTLSYENAKTPNAAEVSPLDMYARLFGRDFQDPNAPTFTPNPRVLVRKSALSVVLDEINDMKRKVGAEDKARLDQYFTGLRHLEQQFDQQLTKPEPIDACQAPPALKGEAKPGTEASLVAERHRMMTDLMVMAIACDQARVFNMSYATPFATTSQLGYDKPHHTDTHEEPIDPGLGYQPHASWFVRRAMESWGYFVEAFTKVKEGDGTLLDNCFIVADTDVSTARIHSLDRMAAFTAGRAGGRVKTGIHIDGGGSALCRLGYTSLRVMGADVTSFGSKSNATSQELGEILV